MSLKPFEKRRVVVQYMPAGDFDIRLIHSDEGLYRSAKGLFVRVRVPGMTDRQITDSSNSLSYSRVSGAFSYLGGGRKRDGQVIRGAGFSLDSPRGFVELEFVSQMDRYMNFDDLRVLEVRPDVFEQIMLDQKMSEVLALRPELLDVTSIVYADIDLNVVDGSSIWISSILSMLAANEPCLFVSKRDIESDIITSNIEGLGNVRFVSPSDFGLKGRALSMQDSIALVQALDRWLPDIRRVYMRGLSAAEELFSTRQFYDRVCVYLTDFYVIEEGVRTVPPEKAAALKIVGRHARRLLAQTEAIEKELQKLIGIEKPFTLIPPPIPAETSIKVNSNEIPFAQRRPLRIGYAGKVVPDWGVEELLDWAKRLRQDGIEVEVTIVANKISGGKLQGEERQAFIQTMQQRLASEAAHHYKDMNREQAMQTMADMDLVWCYRPGTLEDNTLELSTKLVEMVGIGAACVCYPNQQNVTALGEDYPFFAKTYADIENIVQGQATRTPEHIVRKVVDAHSLSKLSLRMRDEVQEKTDQSDRPRIGVAVHDSKFMDAFASHLKSKGYPIRTDRWEWGSAQDATRSAEMFDWADVLFCEWGLANAVWYAERNSQKKPLYVRMHLQEIKERASKFGRVLNIENVTKVIFVSDAVRNTAVEMFGWDPEKTVVIPNYVLPDEYLPVGKPRKSRQVAFGMVGIIPQRKRMDRAIDLLEKAVDAGMDAHLYIKGPRPESLEFMLAPGRAPELVFYKEQYARFERHPKLKHRVHFSPWGNDVALWYERVDFILSCSDFESFHYALADGVLAGCVPLVWPWNEAETLYTKEWVVQDTEAAFDRVQKELAKNQAQRAAGIQANRTLVEKRYGATRIFSKLEQQLVGGADWKSAATDVPLSEEEPVV